MTENLADKKLKIWFFHHYATPPSSTGLTRPFDFAKNLIKMGHLPTLFVSSYLHYSNEQLIKNRDLFKKENSDGVDFIYVRTHSAKGNGINRVINMFDFAINLYRVAKKEADINGKPDVIIASSPHPLTMIVGNFLAKKLGIPCICEIRDLWPESLVEYGYVKRNSLFADILYKGEKWIYSKANALIFTMPGGKKYIQDQGWDNDIDLKKVFNINNGVDIEEFDKNSKTYIKENKYFENKNYKTIVYAGSIRKVNNLDFILNTAKILYNKDKYIKFIIYGYGNELERLIERCKKENIDNVVFMGRVQKKYIPHIISQSTANILNAKVDESSNLTKYGQSQNKLFEYLRAGRPIIQTFTDGFSIINEHDCGFILEKKDPKLLADIILKNIYNDEIMNKKAINAKKASETYSYENHAKKLVEIIDKVIKDYLKEENYE